MACFRTHSVLRGSSTVVDRAAALRRATVGVDGGANYSVRRSRKSRLGGDDNRRPVGDDPHLTPLLARKDS